MKFIAVLLSLCVFSGVANAQEAAGEGITSFASGSNSATWRKSEDSKSAIVQTIVDSVGKSGISNITDAEQVFCYEVSNRPVDYNGYTINNMALTGFCGVINKNLKEMLVKQLFSTPTNISFGNAENCVIRPRLMLRFVKGVDFTDVLLSSPCHSFSIFYGGKVKTYNFKPGAAVIDTIVQSFKNHHVDFTSPALLNQLLPVGVVQTDEQKQIIENKSGPIRGWADEENSEPKEDTKSSGWNKLVK